MPEIKTKTNNLNQNTMSEFIEEVRKLLLEEKGIKLEDADYMDLPEEREKYNTSLVIGNVNLIAGRFKTKKEGVELVDKFLSMPIQSQKI